MRGRRHFGAEVFLSSVEKTASPSYIESCNTKISFSAYKKNCSKPHGASSHQVDLTSGPGWETLCAAGVPPPPPKPKPLGPKREAAGGSAKIFARRRSGKILPPGGGEKRKGGKKRSFLFNNCAYELFGARHAHCVFGAAAKQPRGKKGRGRRGHMIRYCNKSGQYILADFFGMLATRSALQASHLRWAGVVVGRKGEKDRNGRSFLPPPAPQYKEDLGRKSPSPTPHHTSQLPSSSSVRGCALGKTNERKGEKKDSFNFSGALSPPLPPLGSLALEGKRTRLRATPYFDFGFKVRAPVGLAANEKERADLAEESSHGACFNRCVLVPGASGFKQCVCVKIGALLLGGGREREKQRDIWKFRKSALVVFHPHFRRSL